MNSAVLGKRPVVASTPAHLPHNPAVWCSNAQMACELVCKLLSLHAAPRQEAMQCHAAQLGVFSALATAEGLTLQAGFAGYALQSAKLGVSLKVLP